MARYVFGKKFQIKFYFIQNKTNENFFFQRCTEEQEARLNNLTRNIKQSHTAAVPVKQTKMTFVGTEVKPPRDVIKKQVCNLFCR